MFKYKFMVFILYMNYIGFKYKYGFLMFKVVMNHGK